MPNGADMASRSELASPPRFAALMTSVALIGVALWHSSLVGTQLTSIVLAVAAIAVVAARDGGSQRVASSPLARIAFRVGCLMAWALIALAMHLQIPARVRFWYSRDDLMQLTRALDLGSDLPLMPFSVGMYTIHGRTNVGGPHAFRINDDPYVEYSLVHGMMVGPLDYERVTVVLGDGWIIYRDFL